MAGLEARLNLKLGQSLLMTPQLQQAIKLLQLNRLDYEQAIREELLSNPILEEVRDEDRGGDNSDANGDKNSSEGDSENKEFAPAQVEDSPITSDGTTTDSPQTEVADRQLDGFESYLDELSDYRGAATPKGLIDFDDKPSLEQTLTKEKTLEGHLFEQLKLLDFDDQTKTILIHIIGNLDRDGFLEASYEELAHALTLTVDDIAEAAKSLLVLDPVGVGARDVRECLLFQLEAAGHKDTLAYKIVTNHLDKLERRRLDLITKAYEVSQEAVIKAIQVIRTLEPHPGRQFSEETIRYAIPDIYVTKDGSNYVISLNEDGLPKLRISPYYVKLMRQEASSENKQYLNERMKAAAWLIKSIHQRQSTIYRVTESIVKFQREFFDKGVEYLKPLILKDVADDIGMHESTVSRVTSNKYVHTAQGVFELKYFFSSGISTGGGDVASSSIKERIRQLIQSESADNPISDQYIVDVLRKENIEIARRTVAKYRESMGIASSGQRKKLF